MAVDIVARGIAGSTRNLLEKIIIESGTDGLVEVEILPDTLDPSSPAAEQYQLVFTNVLGHKKTIYLPKQDQILVKDKDGIAKNISEVYVSDINIVDTNLVYSTLSGFEKKIKLDEKLTAEDSEVDDLLDDLFGF